MQTEESLERIAADLAEDNQAEGVRYLEVRFAPQLHVRPGLDAIQVLAAVDRGGLNFIYVHLNRVIKERDLSMIYIIGPGHGGPGIVANTWLEGTYTKTYPNISQDEEGRKKMCKQFSFPGGIPSHVAPETPGSIHEGGELGYALSHAYGAAFDNPASLLLLSLATGKPKPGRWPQAGTRTNSSTPRATAACCRSLHLNGYKIANPCFLARIPRDELEQLLRGYGYAPHFVEGDEPRAMLQGGQGRHDFEDRSGGIGGLKDPVLAVSDGAPGLIRALRESFPRTFRQKMPVPQKRQYS